LYNITVVQLKAKGDGRTKGSMQKLKVLTWEIPWLALVEVHLPNGLWVEARVQELLQEIARDDLLVCGVEPEPGGQQQAASFLRFHATLRRHDRSISLFNLSELETLAIWEDYKNRRSIEKPAGSQTEKKKTESEELEKLINKLAS
jgi:hypothetical protein